MTGPTVFGISAVAAGFAVLAARQRLLDDDAEEAPPAG